MVMHCTDWLRIVRFTQRIDADTPDRVPHAEPRNLRINGGPLQPPGPGTTLK
jgi:hypothetical protein